MTPAPRRAETFQYVGYDIAPESNRLTCRYRLDDREFTEEITFPAGGAWDTAAVNEAARLVYLLTAVSYYKAGAPPVIDLGDTAVTDQERAFLTDFYLDGLGEFAYRTEPRLDLSDLQIIGPKLERSAPAEYISQVGRPLLPFGGGVDSIVSVELLKHMAVDTSLFVVNRPDDRFEAIERPAVLTGLPVVRAERLLDDQILRSRELGFFSGHVPVTGILSAIAVMAAALGGHDAVVMSNEWSASVGNVVVDGRSINHQYSKSEAFETGFRQVLAEAIGSGLQYFSLLRPYTELWIARRFSQLPEYFADFRSCNRAFHIDKAKRLDHWCGHCDKCCFIDLILAPFLDAATLRQVFAGNEPLDNPSLVPEFRTLVGLIPDAKPWECVGDVHESQVAATLAAQRPDRGDSAVLTALVTELSRETAPGEIAALLRPVGRHFIPERYAPANLLV